jgi:hypothetical protein
MSNSPAMGIHSMFLFPIRTVAECLTAPDWKLSPSQVAGALFVAAAGFESVLFRTLIQVKADLLYWRHYCTKREPTMPITSVFILAGIILAFIVFGVVLAWAEYQTRHIGRSGRQHSGTSAQVHLLKKIAEDANRTASDQEKADHLG